MTQSLEGVLEVTFTATAMPAHDAECVPTGAAPRELRVRSPDRADLATHPILRACSARTDTPRLPAKAAGLCAPLAPVAGRQPHDVRAANAPGPASPTSLPSLPSWGARSREVSPAQSVHRPWAREAPVGERRPVCGSRQVHVDLRAMSRAPPIPWCHAARVVDRDRGERCRVERLR
jgi:hypothetical protein